MRLLCIRLEPEAPREVSHSLHRLQSVQRSQLDLSRVDPGVIHQRLKRSPRKLLAAVVRRVLYALRWSR
jgi:hypothetical protein